MEAASPLGEFHEDRLQAKRDALAKGRRMRKQRQLLREALKKKELDSFEVIEGTSSEVLEREVVGPMTVHQLLKLMPGVGPALQHEIVEAAKLSPATKLGKMTPERRRDLAWVYRGATTSYVE